jgi:hypothetical protein
MTKMAAIGAAVVILRRAGFRALWSSRTTARIGTWVLIVLMITGTSANVLSQSPWERFLLGPAILALAGLCLVVAISDTEDDLGPVPGGLPGRPAAQATPSNRVEDSR